MSIQQKLNDLVKALEAGGYNVAPSKLSQGSLHLFNPDGTPASAEAHEAEHDLLEAERKTGKCQCPIKDLMAGLPHRDTCPERKK